MPVLQHRVQGMALIRARRWISSTRKSLLATIEFMENCQADVAISINCLASIQETRMEQWRACNAAFEAWEVILPESDDNDLDHWLRSEEHGQLDTINRNA